MVSSSDRKCGVWFISEFLSRARVVPDRKHELPPRIDLGRGRELLRALRAVHEHQRVFRFLSARKPIPCMEARCSRVGAMTEPLTAMPRDALKTRDREKSRRSNHSESETMRVYQCFLGHIAKFP